MIDVPPLPLPLALAVIGWGVAMLGLAWRASARLAGLEARLTQVEGEVENDLTGRKAVAAANDRLTRIETRLDAQDRMLARIDDKLEALTVRTV